MKTETAIAGRCVIWTGLNESGSAVIRAFEQAGARVERHPVIACTLLPPSPDQLPHEGWAVFTSGRAAAAAGQLSPSVRIAAVGSATAAALKRFGRKADLLPRRADAEGLVDTLLREISHRSQKRPVMFFRGDKALSAIPDRLRAAGIDVVEQTVYRTEAVSADAVLRAVERVRQSADAVIFGSPFGVRVFADAVSLAAVEKARPETVWAALGNTTGEALRAAGIREPIIAARPEPEEIVRAIAFAWARASKK